MITPSTRSIFLAPVRDEDISLLWTWRSSDAYRSLCSSRDFFVTREQFVEELSKDREGDRHEQYMIVRKRDKLPIGTIFSYGYSECDGHVFVTCFIDTPCVGKGYGVHATALFVTYLSLEYGIYKVYMDVYADNLASLYLLSRFGLREEGRFAGHRVHRGKRRDVIRLAGFGPSFCKAKALALRFGAIEHIL